MKTLITILTLVIINIVFAQAIVCPPDASTGPWQEDLPNSQITADTKQTSPSHTDTAITAATKRFCCIRLIVVP
jgi:hypothetical protein